MEDMLAIVDRFSFLSESPTAKSNDSKPRQQWQLAIAAGSNDESEADPEATIRNITRATLKR